MMNKSGKGTGMRLGQGQGSGRGQGSGQGSGQGFGQGSGQGSGKGRNKGGAYGAGGFCICVKCGEKIPHKTGVKCTTLKCPVCGHTMIREELVKNKK